MKKLIFVISAAILIVSIYASGCGISTEMVWAPIEDVDIWADNSSSKQYFADVVSGEPNSCYEFHSYNVTRTGNTTRVEIFNVHSIGVACAEIYSYVEHTIPLGSDFVIGVNYTVEVNDLKETFVA